MKHLSKLNATRKEIGAFNLPNKINMKNIFKMLLSFCMMLMCIVPLSVKNVCAKSGEIKAESSSLLRGPVSEYLLDISVGYAGYSSGLYYYEVSVSAQINASEKNYDYITGIKVKNVQVFNSSSKTTTLLNREFTSPKLTASKYQTVTVGTFASSKKYSTVYVYAKEAYLDLTSSGTVSFSIPAVAGTVYVK